MSSVLPLCAPRSSAGGTAGGRGTAHTHSSSAVRSVRNFLRIYCVAKEILNEEDDHLSCPSCKMNSEGETKAYR